MPVKVYDGTNWVTVAGDGAAGAPGTSSSIVTWVKTATGGETSLSGAGDSGYGTLAYTVGQELVYLNGVLLKRGDDYTATTGTSITGLTALTANDVVTVWTVNSFSVANTYTQAQANAAFAPISVTGGMTLLSTTTLSGATTTISSISPTGYNSLYLEISGITCSANNDPYFQINGITTTTYQTATDGVHGTTVDASTRGDRTGVILIATGIVAMKSTGGNNIYGITITNPNSLINKNIFLTGSYEGDVGGYCTFMAQINARDVTSAISSMAFKTSSGTFSGGTVKIYGVK